MVEEAVAVAVREEVDRVEEHDELQRLLEAVGVVHDAGQPEDTRHNRNDKALKVLAERGHRCSRPRKRQKEHKHQRAVEEELQIVPARTDGENDVSVHQNHQHYVYIEPGDRCVGKYSGNRELDLGNELPVCPQGLCALNNTVLNEEPRNNADKHKGEEVNRERVVASEVNMHGFHGFDTDGEREPVYKNRKRGLHNSPAGADNGALVCFNQLVFREQKDLFSKSLVFLENRSNQKTTSLNIEKNIQITVNKTQNDGLNYKSCSPP